MEILNKSPDLFQLYYCHKKKPLLNSLNDYKVFKYILENQIPENSLNYYFDFSKKCLKAIGDRGITFGTGPIPPLMVWIFTVLMVEGVTFGIKDHKKELDELVEAAHKINLKYLDLIVKSAFRNNHSRCRKWCSCINPQIFDEYFLPYHQYYSRGLKKK